MRQVYLSRDKQMHELSAARFVAELEPRLRRELPVADANAVVAETEAHLADRMFDLVSGGLSLSQAERLAIAEFGDPRTYADSLANGFFASRGALRASQAGRALLSITFSLLLMVTVLGKPFVDAIFNACPGLGESIVLGVVFLVPPLTMAIAFKARTSQTKLVIVYGLALTLIAFTCTGYYITRLPSQQLADRRDARSNVRWLRQNSSIVTQQLNELNAGLAAYAHDGDRNQISSDLRVGSSFVVPGPFDRELSASVVNHWYPLPEPFYKWTRDSNGRQVRTPNVVAALTEAKLRWNRDGAKWKSAKKREIAHCESEASVYDGIAREPASFRADNFSVTDLEPALFAIILGILDFAGAWMGRRWFLARRRRHNKLGPQLPVGS